MKIEEHVHAGLFSQTALDAQERIVFGELLRHLGAGEASCIAVATCRNGVVVTDDRAARASCAERKVPFTGTIGILKASCLDGHISVDEAEHILAAMIKHGFYAPVNRMRDVSVQRYPSGEGGRCEARFSLVFEQSTKARGFHEQAQNVIRVV